MLVSISVVRPHVPHNAKGNAPVPASSLLQICVYVRCVLPSPGDCRSAYASNGVSLCELTLRPKITGAWAIARYDGSPRGTTRSSARSRNAVASLRGGDDRSSLTLSATRWEPRASAPVKPEYMYGSAPA